MMKVVRPLALLALTYCLLGPLLLFVESRTSFGREAFVQAFPMAVLSSLYFIYTYVSLWVFHRLYATRGHIPPYFYMASKTLRLLLSIVLLIVYGVWIHQGILLFAVNLFVYYLATMTFTNIYCLRQEKKYRNQ